MADCPYYPMPCPDPHVWCSTCETMVCTGHALDSAAEEHAEKGHDLDEGKENLP